jgi:hypothetical protein
LERDGIPIGAIGVFGDASNEQQDLACATAGSYDLRPAGEASKATSPPSQNGRRGGLG